MNDSWRMQIRVFDVRPDGNIENNRLLLTEPGPGTFQDGIPDGMRCDELGNLYCTGPGGVWVISPEGEHLGTIGIPEPASNMAFGGAGLVDALRHRDTRLPRDWERGGGWLVWVGGKEAPHGGAIMARVP